MFAPGSPSTAQHSTQNTVCEASGRFSWEHLCNNSALTMGIFWDVLWILSDKLLKNIVIWRSGKEAVGQVLVMPHEGLNSDLQHSRDHNRNHSHEKPGSAECSSQHWGREARRPLGLTGGLAKMDGWDPGSGKICVSESDRESDWGNYLYPLQASTYMCACVCIPKHAPQEHGHATPINTQSHAHAHTQGYSYFQLEM